jgi:hypothetical protein
MPAPVPGLLPASPSGAPPPLTPPVDQPAVRDQVTHENLRPRLVVSVEDDTALITGFGPRRAPGRPRTAQAIGVMRRARRAYCQATLLGSYARALRHLNATGKKPGRCRAADRGRA